MTGVLDRVRGWLVEPGPSRAAARTPEAVAAAPASRLAVMASGREARGLGAALALASGRGGGPAAVAVWPGRPPREGEGGEAATPAARRLASAARGHELACRAAGRLVAIELPAGEEEAAAAAARADAVCAAVALVLVVSAPRGPAIDALLATRDLVLVHIADDALADVTLARLAEQGVAAARLAPEAAPGPVVRAMALAGLAAPGVRGLTEACAC